VWHYVGLQFLEQFNRCLDWVLSHWAHFNVLRFIFVCVAYFLLIMCCIIVTWWGGLGGIEAWSLGLLLTSVLWHCWLGHLTDKTHPRYDVFSGMLNSAQSNTMQSFCYFLQHEHTIKWIWACYVTAHYLFPSCDTDSDSEMCVKSVWRMLHGLHPVWYSVV